MRAPRLSLNGRFKKTLPSRVHGLWRTLPRITLCLLLLVAPRNLGTTFQMANNDVQIVISAVDKTKKALDSSSKGVENLAKVAAKASVAIVALGVAAKQAFDMTARSESISDASAALFVFAGNSTKASQTMNAVRSAADGMLSRFDATQAATRILSLGLADTSSEAGELTKIAVTLGDAFGKEALPAVQDFTDMLVTGRLLGLKEYGISVTDVRAMADKLKLSTEGLTDAQATQNAILIVAKQRMEMLADAGYEAGDATAQFSAAWTDFTDTLASTVGVAFTPVLEAGTDFLQSIDEQTRAIDTLGIHLKIGSLSLYEYGDTLITAAEAVDIMNARHAESARYTGLAEMYGALTIGVDDLGQEAESTADALERLNSVNKSLSNTINSTLESIKLTALGIDGLEGHYEDLIAQYLSGGMALHSLEANLEGTRAAAILSDREIGKIGDDETRNQLALLGLSIGEINRLLELVSGTHNIELVLDLIGRFGLGAGAILDNAGRGGGGGKNGSPQMTNSGGPMNKGGWTLIGEGPSGNSPYAELVGPDGMVYPPNKTKEMLQAFKLMGMAPRGLAGGGTLGGANTGFTPQPDGFQVTGGGGITTQFGRSTVTTTRTGAKRVYYSSAGESTIHRGDGTVIYGGGEIYRPRDGGSNGGGGSTQQGEAIARAAASQAAQAAASGVGSTAVTAAQNQSAQAIAEFTRASERQNAELIKKIDQLIRKTIDKSDMTNAVKDAAAAIA